METATKILVINWDEGTIVECTDEGDLIDHLNNLDDTAELEVWQSATELQRIQVSRGWSITKPFDSGDSKDNGDR